MSERLFKRGDVWFCWLYQGGRRIRRTTGCTDRRAAAYRLKELEREAQGGGQPGQAAACGLKAALDALTTDTGIFSPAAGDGLSDERRAVGRRRWDRYGTADRGPRRWRARTWCQTSPPPSTRTILCIFPLRA